MVSIQELAHNGKKSDRLGEHALENQGTKEREQRHNRERVRLFTTLSQRVALNVFSLSIFPSD